MYFLAVSFIIIAAVISSISDASIKIYWDNSLCGSITELSIDVSSIGTNDSLTCKGKDNTKCENSTDYYPIQYCVEVRNTHNCGSDVGNLVKGLLVHLEAISESINSYPVGCLDILQKNNFSTSGYYKILSPNGSLISVYCDMEGINCDGDGGWMRVGYLNMSEPNAICPPGLTLRQFDNIDHGVCGLSNYSSLGSTFFSSGGNNYSEVCGEVRGYQFNSPDGFPPLYNSNASPDIENCNTYVDGVTITYGNNPRKHIWTYAGGLSEGHHAGYLLCPCNTRSYSTTSPSFVSNDNYCESGLPVGQNWLHVLYSSDPLWDGQQCNGNEGPCCVNPKMPWFVKTLDETTTEDIELRVCGNQGGIDEDTPLDIIELYIR